MVHKNNKKRKAGVYLARLLMAPLDQKLLTAEILVKPAMAVTVTAFLVWVQNHTRSVDALKNLPPHWLFVVAGVMVIIGSLDWQIILYKDLPNPDLEEQLKLQEAEEKGLAYKPKPTLRRWVPWFSTSLRLGLIALYAFCAVASYTDFNSPLVKSIQVVDGYGYPVKNSVSKHAWEARMVRASLSIKDTAEELGYAGDNAPDRPYFLRKEAYVGSQKIQIWSANIFPVFSLASTMGEHKHTEFLKLLDNQLATGDYGWIPPIADYLHFWQRDLKIAANRMDTMGLVYSLLYHMNVMDKASLPDDEFKTVVKEAFLRDMDNALQLICGSAASCFPDGSAPNPQLEFEFFPADGEIQLRNKKGELKRYTYVYRPDGMLDLGEEDGIFVMRKGGYFK